jgi:hypothetical protein
MAEDCADGVDIVESVVEAELACLIHDVARYIYVQRVVSRCTVDR